MHYSKENNDLFLGFQEEPEEDLDGRGCGKPCCLNRLEAMAAMAAEMAARGAQEGPTPEVQLEDFGGEQIPDCCQEQIKLLLDDQLNGDEGKTLKDCCTGIWSGFRRFGFRWYKFRLYRQVYAPNGVSEEESDEEMDFEYTEGSIESDILIPNK